MKPSPCTTVRGIRIEPMPYRSATKLPTRATAMMPIGFQNRKAPSAEPTSPGRASAAASAPLRLSTTARQTPFSANRTTRMPSHTAP